MAWTLAKAEGYGRIGVAEAIMLTSATLFGPGMFLFPGDLVHGSQSGAWYGFALDAVATVLASWAWVVLCRRHPARRLPELMGELVGGVAARALSVLVAVFDIAVAAASVSALGEVIASIFVPRTPMWAVEGAFILVLMYGVALGLEVIGRTANFMLPIAWASYVLVYLMAVQTAEEPWNLVPHMPPDGLWGVVSGAYLSLWAFAATTVLPNVLAHISEAEWGRMGAGVVLAAVWDVVMRGMELAIALTILGVTGILWYRWPTVSVLRVVHTQGFLVNRLGAGLLIILVMLVGAFVAVHLWNAHANLVGLRDVRLPSADSERTLTRKGSVARRTGPLTIALVTAAVLALALGLNPGARLHAFALTWLNPAVLALSYGLPACLLLVSLGRHGRSRPWTGEPGPLKR